ncbi:MAG: hypothetical protein ACRD0M_01660, partial [Acidimicrobiales bacterium]
MPQTTPGPLGPAAVSHLFSPAERWGFAPSPAATPAIRAATVLGQPAGPSLGPGEMMLRMGVVGTSTLAPALGLQAGGWQALAGLGVYGAVALAALGTLGALGALAGLVLVAVVPVPTLIAGVVLLATGTARVARA